jgi:hypothetical protein
LQIEAYAVSKGYPAKCSFSSVLEQFALEAQQEELYKLCNQSNMVAIAQAIDGFEPLSLGERHMFCIAPVDRKKVPAFNAFLLFVERYVLAAPSDPSRVLATVDMHMNQAARVPCWPQSIVQGGGAGMRPTSGCH